MKLIAALKTLEAQYRDKASVDSFKM